MKKFNYLTLIFAIFLIACSGNPENKGEQTAVSENVEKQQTVCIWDGVPVRETPSKDGKWISKISLGETLYYLGETAIDSTDNNREYIKVELSDGKVAWARNYGLVIEGKIAAIKENVPVYERPDLLTLTKKEFYKMNVLAIEETKEDWIKVIGKERKIKGWIKSNVVTENKEDIAVAIMASKQLIDKDNEIIVEKIEEFIEEVPYKNSIFIEYLREKLAEQQAVEEEIIEEAIDSSETVVE